MRLNAGEITLRIRAVCACNHQFERRSLLAVLLQSQSDFSAAALLYRKAAEIDGGADLYAAEVDCLRSAGLDGDAIDRLRQIVAQHPETHEAQYLLAQHEVETSRSLSAESRLRRLLRNEPTHLNSWAALSNIYIKRGDAPKAIGAIRSLLRANPALSGQHASLLWTMLHGGASPRAVFAEQRRWAKQHLAGITPHSTHANSPDPARRLRIAYISDQFKESAISFCDEIILAAHDRRQVELFLYNDTAKCDAMTERRRELADGWRDIQGKSHEEVAELIRRDRIDILLNQCDYHWGRMAVFARKPAPIQMALPYYPASTGLPQIDYFVTDPRTNPAGRYTEQLLYVPHLLTYWPRDYAPQVSPPPARANGYITFGSFHRLLKFNRELIALWSRILNETPGSRLLIHHLLGKPVDDGVARQVRRWFEREGIGIDRIELVGTLAQPEHYTLDAFPYSGHTTTCTATWMGVPVVALRGQTHVARVSASILESVKLQELIADTPDQYARIAIELAHDRRRLARLRATIRERMRKSPLMDGKAVARGLEAAFRRAWHHWCEKQNA